MIVVFVGGAIVWMAVRVEILVVRMTGALSTGRAGCVTVFVAHTFPFIQSFSIVEFSSVFDLFFGPV